MSTVPRVGESIIGLWRQRWDSRMYGEFLHSGCPDIYGVRREAIEQFVDTVSGPRLVVVRPSLEYRQMWNGVSDRGGRNAATVVRY